MSKPLIGLTSYSRTDDGQFTIPARYLESIERAGGLGIVVTPSSGCIESLVSEMNGFVLTGGADVSPSEYGGNDHASIYGVNAERDSFELALVGAVAKRKSPLMAICRGVQVLNVALGGTLVEHVPDEYGESVMHRSADFDRTEHSIRLDSDSRLAEIMGCTDFSCASFHHQSIRSPAPGFKVCGRAEDGVIEAVESDRYSKLIAIQWHPEYTAREDSLQQGLFDTLVAWAGNGQ